jgi:LAO/AO transport system kinase
MAVESLVARVLDGHVASGARLIRRLEDGDAEARAALPALRAWAGRAQLVGVTGPPGAGKSTLVDALVSGWRGNGLRVGVVAVDPTSPLSQGALLGDRVRMQRHATDPGVFIRSMASRGRLGGLSRATADACLVLDAMGYDRIAIETVGVGQDEVEVIGLAHTTCVVCLPGSGDVVQSMKAGILEVGDCLVLNKADQPGADEAARALFQMLHLREPDADGWELRLFETVASVGKGVPELIEAIEAHGRRLREGGGFARHAARRARARVFETLRERTETRTREAIHARRDLARLIEDVERGSLDPDVAADHLVAAILAPASDRPSEKEPEA